MAAAVRPLAGGTAKLAEAGATVEVK